VLPYFFGYGSLVNLATHDFPDPRPATLKGWRRRWRHTEMREVAYLTVEPDAEAAIDGIIASVPGSDWAALDLREAAYDRLPVVADHLQHDHPDQISVHIYCTRANEDSHPSVRHPILLSYLDTVAAGFFQQFGQSGVERFFQTTDGWDAPVLDDRAAPIYPRAVAPSATFRAEIDACLEERGAKRIKA